jgi:hypothetical protein
MGRTDIPNIQNGKIPSSCFKKMHSGSEGSEAVVLNLSFVVQKTTFRIG